jgi:PEP-CTERM motif
MKTRTNITRALVGAAITLALTSSGFAQTTTWFYGASDNSANFSVSADSSSAITWQDGWASGNVLGNNNFFGSQSIQSNRPNQFSQNQAISLYSFGGTGLLSGNVTSALLYLRQDFSSNAQSWNIVGLAAGNSGWDTNTMTWNDINGAGAGDWTGGTLGASLSGSYGSFTSTGLGTDTNISVDITSAFQAYLDGTITGIAFVNATIGTTTSAGDNRFIPFSNDNDTATNRPGLLVTAIPEPSAALLGGLGLLALLRRRR